jgi:phosphoenolpyruvate-protein kinase (PTS system EI component)
MYENNNVQYQTNVAAETKEELPTTEPKKTKEELEQEKLIKQIEKAQENLKKLQKKQKEQQEARKLKAANAVFELVSKTIQDGNSLDSIKKELKAIIKTV